MAPPLDAALAIRAPFPLNGAMAARPPDYRTLASLSRIMLLHELQQCGQKTVAELAEATGLHHNTTREHLHRLIEAQERAAAAHRRTAGPPLLQLRAVGRARTAADRQLDLLGDHMGQCGFDVDIDEGGTRMTMHRCPFGELAKAHPQVCQVHFELVKDALHLVNGPVRATALQPFSGPDDCTVDFTVAEPGEPTGGETATDRR